MYPLTRLTPILGALLTATPAPAQQFSPPQPPQGAAPGQVIPARDAAGRYLTVNTGISLEEAAWHMRAALNVAALGCRDAQERETVAAYNAMLAIHRAPLAAADLAVKSQYRFRYGAAAQSRHDGTMTKVYNFFAQPPAQRAFCETARTVLREIASVAPARFHDYAGTALPRLEPPFTDFYRAFEGYRVAMAEWRAGQAGQPGQPGQAIMAAASVVAQMPEATASRRRH